MLDRWRKAVENAPEDAVANMQAFIAKYPLLEAVLKGKPVSIELKITPKTGG